MEKIDNTGKTLGNFILAQMWPPCHHFFNFDCNIDMLHLKMIVLKRGIQLNKNFSNLSNPFLTTTQNDKKKKKAHF